MVQTQRRQEAENSQRMPPITFSGSSHGPLCHSSCLMGSIAHPAKTADSQFWGNSLNGWPAQWNISYSLFRPCLVMSCNVQTLGCSSLGPESLSPLMYRIGRKTPGFGFPWPYQLQVGRVVPKCEHGIDVASQGGFPTVFSHCTSSKKAPSSNQRLEAVLNHIGLQPSQSASTYQQLSSRYELLTC